MMKNNKKKNMLKVRNKELKCSRIGCTVLDGALIYKLLISFVRFMRNTSPNTRNSNIQLGPLFLAYFWRVMSCRSVHYSWSCYFVKRVVWAVRTSGFERKTTNRLCQSDSSWAPGLRNRQQSRTFDRLAALLKNGDKLGVFFATFSSYMMTPPDSCGFSNQSLCSADNSIGGADRSVGDNYRGTCQVQVWRRFQICKHIDVADTLYLNSYSNCREFPKYGKEWQICFSFYMHFFFFFYTAHSGGKRLKGATIISILFFFQDV